jgi:hypothetical protein
LRGSDASGKSETGADHMQVYWYFLIPAIFLAIFSGEIDKAVKADQKVRNVILVFCGGVSLICIIAILASLFA